MQLGKKLLWLVTRTGHIPGLPTVVTGVAYWKFTDEIYWLWKLTTILGLMGQTRLMKLLQSTSSELAPKWSALGSYRVDFIAMAVAFPSTHPKFINV